MKTILRYIKGLLLLAVLLVMPAVNAEAAPEGTRLFNIRINDGYLQTTVPVYETAAESGMVLTADAQTLIVNRASKTVTAKVVSKSAYYKKNYTSASVTKKAALKENVVKTLTVTAKQADGTARTCTVSVLRPAKPAVSSVTPKSRSFTAGTQLSFTIKTTSKIPVTLTMKVTSGSTEILTKTAGASTNENQKFMWYWDGKDANGSAVAPGDYQVTASLSYLYGKKYKSVSKNTAVTVTAPADQAETDETKNTAAGLNFTKTWDWTVMVTGSDTVDYLAELICQQVLTPGMTEVQRAKALYGYCMTHCSLIRKNSWAAAKAAGAPEKIDITSSAAKKRIKAYGKIVDKMLAAGTAVQKIDGTVKFNENNTKTAMARECGDCSNMARMYQVLCRHAGLDADILYNPNYPHFWNVVQIAGKWYECDPRLSFLRGAGKTEGYAHFLRGTKFMETNNPKQFNGPDDVRRYGTISSAAAYQALYKKVSKTDCPGR